MPPSACSTSQSRIDLALAQRVEPVTARSERPIRRWISCVRPDCLPRAASRAVRVLVERGSMPYSAVTQPLPVLRRNGGTRSSTVAVHRTWVSPKRTRQEPSAWRAASSSRLTVRSWSWARPEGRIGGFPEVGGRAVLAQAGRHLNAGGSFRHGVGPGLHRLGHAFAPSARWLVEHRRRAGEQERARPGPRRRRTAPGGGRDRRADDRRP